MSMSFCRRSYGQRLSIVVNVGRRINSTHKGITHIVATVANKMSQYATRDNVPRYGESRSELIINWLTCTKYFGGISSLITSNGVQANEKVVLLHTPDMEGSRI
jgi:hypothetical protein